MTPYSHIWAPVHQDLLTETERTSEAAFWDPIQQPWAMQLPTNMTGSSYSSSSHMKRVEYLQYYTLLRIYRQQSYAIRTAIETLLTAQHQLASDFMFRETSFHQMRIKFEIWRNVSSQSEVYRPSDLTPGGSMWKNSELKLHLSKSSSVHANWKDLNRMPTSDKTVETER